MKTIYIIFSILIIFTILFQPYQVDYYDTDKNNYINSQESIKLVTENYEIVKSKIIYNFILAPTLHSESIRNNKIYYKYNNEGVKYNLFEGEYFYFLTYNFSTNVYFSTIIIETLLFVFLFIFKIKKSNT